MSLKPAFLLDPAVVFLNHGSFGACPREVLEAQHALQRRMEANPVAFLGRESATLLRAARESLAAFVGAQADDLAFVPNATHGVALAAAAVPLAPGDEVLTTDLEYGACLATLERLCAAAGAVLRRVPTALPLDDARFTAGLVAAMGPRTRLLLVSHVASSTALCLPVAALVAAARERGVAVLVDGAHGPGQVPLALDVLGADFYTGNCHKWMCAPKGSAFLHVRRGRHAAVQAPLASWGHVAEALGGAGALPADTPFDSFAGHTLLERRLQWLGTRDITPWLAVPAAIGWLQRHDGPAGAARAHDAAVALMHRHCRRWGLPPLGPDHAFARMVPLPVPLPLPAPLPAPAPVPAHADPAAALQMRLFDAFRIEVPVTVHAGQALVRVSVGPATDEGDLAALERALELVLERALDAVPGTRAASAQSLAPPTRPAADTMTALPALPAAAPAAAPAGAPASVPAKARADASAPPAALAGLAPLRALPTGDGVEVIDQRALPHRLQHETLRSVPDVVQAIRDMWVRGAPLIGATAAFGIALQARRDAGDAALDAAAAALRSARPTAVNLAWAVDRMQRTLADLPVADRAAAAWQAAAAIADEDAAVNAAIGRHALPLLEAVWARTGRPVQVLTHCNAGWLATVAWGTATSPVYQAHAAGLPVHVWVDETRPRNQGASLTAWELRQAGVPHTLVADNAGGHLMQHGQVDLVIVGCDRVTARGDVCNKIGTYLKALAAHDNGVPFYVAMPSSTLDPALNDGLREIEIEERSPREVTHLSGLDADGRLVEVLLPPAGTAAANPAFDVTPARLVTGLVTEHGIVAADAAALRALATRG